MRSIEEVSEELGLSSYTERFGRGKAKVALEALSEPPRGRGRLVLVSAINPTPAGEGKTTSSIALSMAMRKLGKNVSLALREPSLGPVFGVKGGGTGGGKASLHPADDINLHFTGDLHAITSAHNLLSALIDNALHFHDTFEGSPLDPRRVRWGRALDMNDRALRKVIVGLGGTTGGVPREERVDITAASEIMAVVALATGYQDLEQRLSRIWVGNTLSGKPVRAGDLGAPGAMVALLRDALLPNLVQTLEGGPAFVHAGPFANIAHGCNSVLATRLALSCSDYVVTEAGFGFDLGGEKFLDIKCREAGMFPRAVVLVATLRALKMHGGAPVKEAKAPDLEKLVGGIAHLLHHVASVRSYGLAPFVLLNRFPEDPEGEVAYLKGALQENGILFGVSEGFARGGEGAVEAAEALSALVDKTDDAPPPPTFAYPLDATYEEKITRVATRVYGARGVEFSAEAKKDLAHIQSLSPAPLPICMAKTQLSLSDDPSRPGVPKDFTISVRGVRPSLGAGFIVALTGDMMTMPGLPKVPAARGVSLQPDGKIRGLMQND